MLLDHLPEDEDYMDLKHGDAMLPNGRSARLVFPLKQDRVRNKLTGERREFWLEMIDIFTDEKLRDIFKGAFEPELKKRFNDMPLSEVPALPVPMLMRDIANYRISIHHDIDTKVITTQYYLPRDHSQEHLGTNIYRRNPDGGFALARKMDFSPGVSYAFAVSKHSWHAVDKMGENEGIRNSMMLIYFRVPGIDY
jgi:hypothetical protein